MNETQEALNSLKGRDLFHKTKLILIQDVYSYFPAFNVSKNKDFLRDLAKELGFEVGPEATIPEISRIVRLPDGFKLNHSSDVEKKNIYNNEKRYEELAVTKRKRTAHQSVYFMYHEGHTNAVKRKVRIEDLL